MKKLHYIHSLSHTSINHYTILKSFPEDIKKILLFDNNYPSIESVGGCELFIYTLPVVDEHNHFKLIECDIVIGIDDVFVITTIDNSYIGKIVKEIKYNRKHIPTVYKMLVALSHHILSHMKAIDQIIYILQSQATTTQGYTEQMMYDIMDLKMSIGMFKSTMDPMIDMMTHVFETISYDDHDLQTIHWNNIDQRIKQMKSTIQHAYENISIIADTSNAIQNIKSNNIMKILTIISAIFIPLSFITGLFGMNFIDMPGLNRLGWYYITLLVMIFIGLGQLYVFKKKKRL